MLRSVASKTRRHLVSEDRPNIADDSQVGTGQPGPRHRGERFGVDGGLGPRAADQHRDGFPTN
jgi:hypothetical protein